MNSLRNAKEKGIIVVDVTQAQDGTVNINGYETGYDLSAVGVISGFDMTPEASIRQAFVVVRSCGRHKSSSDQ
eukprot:gnl/Chilomastix_caulleri/4416.p2 GENE.gnl/Chilomastix_caulleri/4416~~gnl/Chilomastix_caulleri/4416.p2  ORF type:complete len:73 (+),score=16.29 gnl/Chilomastix_caulleri/4416:185-403(+)